MTQKYVGQKLIEAWTVYCDGKEGYAVKYEDGYTLWRPKEFFEQAYQLVKDGMSFAGALYMIKRGYKLARKGWNRPGQWVVMMSGLKLPPFNDQTTQRKVNDRTAKIIGEDTPLDSQPYFVLWTAQQKWQPGWVPSTSDLLADDWIVVE